MLYIYLSFCGGALIFDHLHDGSNGRFKELGYIRSGLKICKYPSGSRCFLNRPLPEELQLTRFYIKFRCTVPQASELDIKSLIWIDEARFGCLVEYLGNKRYFICEFWSSEKIFKKCISIKEMRGWVHLSHFQENLWSFGSQISILLRHLYLLSTLRYTGSGTHAYIAELKSLRSSDLMLSCTR